MVREKTKLFDFLNSVNFDKKYMIDDDNKRDYVPFVINRFLSGSPDAILYVNEMNQRGHLSPDKQYDYYFYALRKAKRFNKWQKKDKIENIDLVKEYFKYSTNEAKHVIHLFSPEDFMEMRKSLAKGGKG